MSEEPRLSFVGRTLPAHFRHEQRRLVPGCELTFDPADWRGALVVVEEGVLEVECLDASSERFRAGAVLFLDRLPVRLLRNPSAVGVLLSVVTQRAASDQHVSQSPAERR
jgi:hypothetical protein